MTVRAGEHALSMVGLTAEQRTALLNHARAELLAGRPDASADAARALTVLDPMCHEGWSALAAAHRGAGRLVDARVATEMARVLEGQ